MSALGIRIDGADSGFPAVCDSRLVDAGAGVAAPRGLGAGKDEGAGDPAFFHDPQVRSLQDGRQGSRFGQGPWVRRRGPEAGAASAARVPA